MLNRDKLDAFSISLRGRRKKKASKEEERGDYFPSLLFALPFPSILFQLNRLPRTGYILIES